MKPSDCISGKWYYFKWLFHSQPVYFKYNMTISSNILVGRCSIWKTGYTHGGAYREDEIEDLVEVDPSISDIQSRLPVDHPDKIVPLPVASLPIESLPDPKPIGPSLGITDLVAGEWYKFRFNRNLVYARLYELSGDIYFVTTELIYLGCYSRVRYSFSVCGIKSIELADMKDPIFEKHLPKYPRWYIKYPSYTRDVKFRKDIDKLLLTLAKIRLLSATADSFLLPEPIKMATNSASLKALLPLSIIFSRGLSSPDQWVIGKLVASKC